MARQGPGSHVEEFGLYLQAMGESRTDFKEQVSGMSGDTFCRIVQ